MEGNVSSAHTVLFKVSWYIAVADVCSIIVCYKRVNMSDESFTILRDFRLLPWCKWDVHFTGILSVCAV